MFKNLLAIASATMVLGFASHSLASPASSEPILGTCEVSLGTNSVTAPCVAVLTGDTTENIAVVGFFFDEDITIQYGGNFVRQNTIDVKIVALAGSEPASVTGKCTASVNQLTCFAINPEDQTQLQVKFVSSE